MRNLIIILPNNLGDVIMALPVLEAVKRQYAGTDITFLVEEGYEGGLIANPNCDHIAALPRKALKAAALTQHWRDGLSMLTGFVAAIKSRGIDTVVNLSQHPYLSYLTPLFGASRIAGQRFLPEGNHAIPDAWSQYLYAIPFARRYNSLHATDVYCRMAGVTPPGAGTAITLHADERSSAARYLVARDIPPEAPVIVFQPGAAWASKQWPPESFVELGGKLIADGYQIVITGASAEIEVAQAIARNLGRGCVVAAGERTFRESIAVVACAKIVVTGDTAIMHAAAAAGVRTIALFGPTNPVETGPYGNGHTVIAGTCADRPCFRAACPGCPCMRSIAPETVYRCIRDAAYTEPGSAIFTTGTGRQGYHLVNNGGGGAVLYDEAGASITRRVAESDLTSVTAHPDSPDIGRSRRFADLCSAMERTLSAYAQQRSPEALAMFEKLRREGASIGGIADFWTAWLNIRLNSIPLLDPAAGLRMSIEVCRQTGERIFRSLAQ
jgi:ADP-heptose:LPS heptosyltransferase